MHLRKGFQRDLASIEVSDARTVRYSNTPSHSRSQYAPSCTHLVHPLTRHLLLPLNPLAQCILSFSPCNGPFRRNLSTLPQTHFTNTLSSNISHILSCIFSPSQALLATIQPDEEQDMVYESRKVTIETDDSHPVNTPLHMRSQFPLITSSRTPSHSPFHHTHP